MSRLLVARLLIFASLDKRHNLTREKTAIVQLNKNKIINDPVHGFIMLPYPILFDLVEHPYFQRLRRIQQLGLTNYVYPGAQHTRFAHAIGAMHLMHRTLEILKLKGTEISDEEAKGALIAILLHDIGHGPFSHTLENTILPVHHEELSLIIMRHLNDLFDGQLDLAIRIFMGDYERAFFHQLVSSQLDMDRMDYLSRDSFFTGVNEGVIGSERLIHMLRVVEDEIVVEEKGIYSIEKYLTARSIMYWQTYLHKTVLSAEKMLVSFFQRLKSVYETYENWIVTPAFDRILRAQSREEVKLEDYIALDDHDVMFMLKCSQDHPDEILSYLARSIIDRRLFACELQNETFDKSRIQKLKVTLVDKFRLSIEDVSFLVLQGQESNITYTTEKAQIKVLTKSQEVLPLSAILKTSVAPRMIKHYLCYPKYV